MKKIIILVSILGFILSALTCTSAYAETKTYSCNYKQDGTNIGENFSFSYDSSNKKIVLKDYPEGDGTLGDELRMGRISEESGMLEFNVESVSDGYADMGVNYTLHYDSLDFFSATTFFNEDGSLSGRGSMSEGSCMRILNWDEKEDGSSDTSSSKKSEGLTDFSVEGNKGESIGSISNPAPAILVTQHDNDFRTRIRDAAKQPVNFANHYTISTWGCGTQCEQGVAVDALTGKVTWLPFTAVISFMTDPNWKDESSSVDEIFNYKKSSNQLTIYAYNEGGSGELYNEHHYKMEDGEFKLISRSKP